MQGVTISLPDELLAAFSGHGQDRLTTWKNSWKKQCAWKCLVRRYKVVNTLCARAPSRRLP